MNRVRCFLLTIGTLAASCGGDDSATPKTPSEQGTEVSTGETSASNGSQSENTGNGETNPAHCSFVRKREDSDNDKPQCDGLSEIDCLDTPACQTVRGRTVESCDLDSVACLPDETYLGCAGVVICKQEIGFFCSLDFTTTYVAERRCNPPAGTVLCTPEVDDLERLIDTAFFSCI